MYSRKENKNTTKDLIKVSSRHKQKKHNILKKGYLVICLCIMSIFAFGTSASAISGGSAFFNQAFTVLEILIALIGGGLALWGIVNLLEGYGNDNPGAKSQGMKQLMAGAGVILIAVLLVPELGKLFTANAGNSLG